MLAGFLEGEAGGARMAAMRGLGAVFLAGEKCCWRVEKAGRSRWAAVDAPVPAPPDHCRRCDVIGGAFFAAVTETVVLVE